MLTENPSSNGEELDDPEPPQEIRKSRTKKKKSTTTKKPSVKKKTKKKTIPSKPPSTSPKSPPKRVAKPQSPPAPSQDEASYESAQSSIESGHPQDKKSDSGHGSHTVGKTSGSVAYPDGEPSPDAPLTREEIEQLPPLTAVALAARCALRVQPLMRPSVFREVDWGHLCRWIRDIDVAISTAQLVAATLDGADHFNKASADIAHAVFSDSSVNLTYAADFNPVASSLAASSAAATAHIATTATSSAPLKANIAAEVFRKASGCIAHAVRAVDASAIDSRALHMASRHDWAVLLSKENSSKDLHGKIDSGQVQNHILTDLQIWPVRPPDAWREKFITPWLDDLQQLESIRPGMVEIGQRYLRQYDHGVFDEAGAERSVIEWYEEYQSDQHQDRAGESKEAGVESDSETDEEKQGSEPEIDEPHDLPDRSGSPTSIVDEPSEVDHLQRKPLVNALAAMFVAQEQATPFTMALLGPWGAGKSSVLAQLEHQLESAPEHGGEVRCLANRSNEEGQAPTIRRFFFAHFNAWEYEHTNDVRAGLAQEVVHSLVSDLDPKQALTEIRWDLVGQWLVLRGRPFLPNSWMKRSLRVGMSRRRKVLGRKSRLWLKRLWNLWCAQTQLRLRYAWASDPQIVLRGVAVLAMVFGGLMAFWLTYLAGVFEPGDFVPRFLDSVAAGVVGSAVLAGGVTILVLRRLKHVYEHPLVSDLRTYMRLPDYGEQLGDVPVMHGHIQTLCRLRGIGRGSDHRLVVFVDDLDRCQPKCIAAVFDAIRLVMNIPNVIVVVAVDDRIAFRAMAKHYKQMAAKSRSPESLARDYLGKIIQLPVTLSKPQSMNEFIREHLFNTVDAQLIGDASRRLQNEVQTFSGQFKKTFDTDDSRDGGLARPSISKSNESTPRGTSEAGSGAETVASSEVSDGTDRYTSARATIDHLTDPAQSVEVIFTTGEVARSTIKIMPESPEDCAVFERLAEAFGVTNPRRLIRLRNTFRFLVNFNHERRFVIDDRQAVAMLFWLDFLNQFDGDVQSICEQVLLTRNKPQRSLPNDAAMVVWSDSGMIGEALQYVNRLTFSRDGFTEDDYRKLAVMVGRFVLPYGARAFSQESSSQTKVEPLEDS